MRRGQKALTTLLLLAASPLFGLSGSGDSAPGSLDTVPPHPGTAVVPLTGIVTGEAISFSGASDASGLARVELWARPDGGGWGLSAAVTDGNAAGVFSFIPGATGTYYFDLVAEDTVGNRSAAPSGATGIGQGGANFTSSVVDWTLLDQ